MGVLVVNKGGIIVAEVTDSITMEEWFGLFDSVADLAEETGAQQGLVVLDEDSGQLDTIERHRLGVHAARVLPRTMRLAVVAPADLITHMFSETARHRGVIVKVFDNVTDAEAWLASG